jgi:xylan 1,4-beta-xylosidase
VTLPEDSVNNQEYYIRDLPAQTRGNVKIRITDIPAGPYRLEVFKVGYRANDPYTTYFDMGRPGQLTKEQVQKIKTLNDGSAISSETIVLGNGKVFERTMQIRENDVYLIVLKKQ